MADDGMTPIDSSVFTHHRYDANTRKLRVRYHSGAVWEHDDVPAEKYAAFTESASPGRYFNSKIRANHPGRKVSE
jgi:hypothetical protein